jgi:hypothetical protein
MSIQELFAREQAYAIDLGNLPEDGRIGDIRQRCQELVRLDAAHRRAEKLVEEMKKRRDRLAKTVIPELMDETGTDVIGLPEAGVDIVLKPWVFASIRKDTPDDVRDAIFAHLEELGGGSLPKASVVVNFPREELDKARSFRAAATAWLEKGYGNSTPPPVELDVTVHHATLTAWLKSFLFDEEMRRGRPPIDLELLGASVGRVCEITKRRISSITKRKARR